MYQYDGTRYDTKVIVSEEDNRLSFQEMGIFLAFGIFNDTNDNAYDPRYLEWDIKLQTYENGKLVNQTNVDLRKCGYEDVSYFSDLDTGLETYLSGMICIKDFSKIVV